MSIKIVFTTPALEQRQQETYISCLKISLIQPENLGDLLSSSIMGSASENHSSYLALASFVDHEPKPNTQAKRQILHQ